MKPLSSSSVNAVDGIAGSEPRSRKESFNPMHQTDEAGSLELTEPSKLASESSGGVRKQISHKASAKALFEQQEHSIDDWLAHRVPFVSYIKW